MAEVLETTMVQLICTDGEVIDIPQEAQGVATGFGRILNPGPTADGCWKWDDGETVVACLATDSGAMPVADAYQELHRRWAEQMAAELAAFEATFEHTPNESPEDIEEREWKRIEHLYEVQDSFR